MEAAKVCLLQKYGKMGELHYNLTCINIRSNYCLTVHGHLCSWLCCMGLNNSLPTRLLCAALNRTGNWLTTLTHSWTNSLVCPVLQWTELGSSESLTTTVIGVSCFGKLLASFSGDVGLWHRLNGFSDNADFTCLPSCCLAMDVFLGSSIPAFRRYVTVLCYMHWIKSDANSFHIKYLYCITFLIIHMSYHMWCDGQCTVTLQLGQNFY
jgi:hypothetical protein